MKATDQGCDNVAVFGMVIVAGSIEIGRHHTDEIASVLPAIGFRHLDAGNLGDCIGLVGRLERAGQHRVLAQGLRRKFWIDAGRAQEHQLLRAVQVRGVDDVRGNRDVVVDELGAQPVVGDDTADLCRGEKDHLRPHLREPVEHGGLVAQIDLAAIGRDETHVLRREPARERAADHAAMAGDIDAFALQLKWCACHRRPPASPR